MKQNINVQNLLPKDKFDEEGITTLKELSFEQIKPIIPNLLEWLQDMNWPVAGSIAEILKPFTNSITDELIKILETDDGMWKYWILVVFARDTSNSLLIAQLKRITTQPTKDEIMDEVNVLAEAILNGEFK